MPRPLGYKRRDAKKLEARRFAAMARLHRGGFTTPMLGLLFRSLPKSSRASLSSLGRVGKLDSIGKSRQAASACSSLRILMQVCPETKSSVASGRYVTEPLSALRER